MSSQPSQEPPIFPFEMVCTCDEAGCPLQETRVPNSTIANEIRVWESGTEKIILEFFSKLVLLAAWEQIESAFLSEKMRILRAGFPEYLPEY